MEEKKFTLQLFAEGDGAAETGDTAADAGQQTLRELGVPEEKLRKHRAKASSLPENAPGQEKPSWEDILSDPEYNARIQQIVKDRVKHARRAQEAMEALSPAIAALARRSGMDPENPDYAALAQRIAPPEISPRQRIAGHMEKLRRQGDAMKETHPGFDLAAELRNPAFARLVGPGTDLSVEDAYYAIHRRELQAEAARATARKLSNAIRSGSLRPEEGGAAAQSPAVTAFDYSRATKQQREELKARIRAAAAKGEKLYPGR